MRPARSSVERPAAPDENLLTDAAKSLEEHYGFDTQQWEVSDRIDRPSSSLFRLRALSADGAMGAYYKRSVPPPYRAERRQRWIDNIRSGLERSVELEARLAELVADEGIVFSRTLSVDPIDLAIVTLEVPGQPFGKPWRHILGSDRRGWAAEWLHRVGRAANLIEQCTVGRIEVEESQREAAIDRRIDRVGEVLTPDSAKRLRSRMEELDRLAHRGARATIYAHGDLSPTNILTGDQLGLIDFTWPIKVRGFDIAHLAFRLEYDTIAPPSWTAMLTRSLMEGYGAPDLTEQPGWHLTRLVKLLKIVTDARMSSRLSGRTRRAIYEIERV